MMSTEPEYMGNLGDGFQLTDAQADALEHLHTYESGEHMATLLFGTCGVVWAGMPDDILVEVQRASGEVGFVVIRIDGTREPAPDGMLGEF